MSSVLNSQQIRVGILRGGPSPEYDISLKTGEHIMSEMPEKFAPVDVYISKDGAWHIDGRAKPVNKIFDQVDVFFNALHGKYGEDGKVQRLLETFGKPYTGSRILQSALCMNKAYAKAIYQMNGLRTPVHIVLGHKHHTKREIRNLFKTFPHPSIVKPIDAGSSLAISIAKTLRELEEALEKAFRFSSAVVVEEYIRGSEATCSVLEGNDGMVFALEPVEIVPHEDKNFFDYEAKYENKSEEICPSRFPSEIIEQLQELALAAHKVLGLRHYSRTDFIISPRRGIYLLETNSLPGLTRNSLYPKSLNTAGISMKEFIEHILNMALLSR